MILFGFMIGGWIMNINVDWLATVFPQLKDFSLLGEGGQKWVFCCTHNTYGDVVLKLIKPGAEGRLDREIEATKRVPSSAPTIYEVGVVESQIGQVIVILEQFIKGMTLSKAISVGPLNQQQLLSLAHDLLLAAAEAEAQKIVHRDIKPDNVILDENGKAWLLDFGIVRILDLDSKTRTDAAFGPHSPGYSALEQFRNRKSEIDGRTDLFSIGVTLYEAATGENPFIKELETEWRFYTASNNFNFQ